MKDIWIVEFNDDGANYVDNRLWNVELLRTSIESNMNNLIGHMPKCGDWHVVGMAESYEDALTLRDKLKHRLEEC